MSPLPVPRLLPVALLALLALVVVPQGGATEVPIGGVFAGTGSAYAFEAFENGVSIGGGAFTNSEACTSCLIRVTLTDTTHFELVENGNAGPIAPGTYELRDFAGEFSYNYVQPHDFQVVLVGYGQINQIA